MTVRPGLFLAAILILAVAGCGGGGSDGGFSRTSAVTPAPGANSIAAPALNVLPIAVNSGIAKTINLAFTTVRICQPGNASNCQDVGNILIDTASSGLRVMASALPAALNLTQQVDAAGNTIAECAQFASGNSWGPVKTADVEMSGERASSLPIHVIGNVGVVPGSCAASASGLRNDAASFGANGVLGVSIYTQDCGSLCAPGTARNPGWYFACSATTCTATTRTLDQQVQNPVTRFAVDNNGVIIQLPGVGDSGAASVTGALVFGIGTRTNNGLGSATVLTVDVAKNGHFTTNYNGRAITSSFIDSGSNALFFSDTIPGCTMAKGFYCPVSKLSLSAQLIGMNGAAATVNFAVGNADALTASNPGFTAFANLASPAFAFGFDWGLPFFYGRNVFVAFEGKTAAGIAGPYIAF